MVNDTNKSPSLELLVSTMNRNNLDFLIQMLPHHDVSTLNILVINQTTENDLLTSETDSIRVINSFEIGLPQSRNLALENAKGDICLIADDDVVYEPGFDKKIIETFLARPEGDIITFQMTDLNGNLFRDYKSKLIHDKKTISTANSVVIAFNRKRQAESHVKFNTNFGLGTTFETANEYVFLRNALSSGLQLFFEPIVLLKHEVFSSGKDSGSDKIIFARAALYYKYSGLLRYLRLCKYLYALTRTKEISKKAFISKYRIGLKGIATYKQLVKAGKEIP